MGCKLYYSVAGVPGGQRHSRMVVSVYGRQGAAAKGSEAMPKQWLYHGFEYTIAGSAIVGINGVGPRKR